MAVQSQGGLIVLFLRPYRTIQKNIYTLKEANLHEISYYHMVIIGMVFNLRASFYFRLVNLLPILMVFITLKIFNVDANIA